MTDIRHDWSKAEAEALLALPLNDLLFRAATVHRAHFDANEAAQTPHQERISAG